MCRERRRQPPARKCRYAREKRAKCRDGRAPPSIHDLFVNDRHRRFFQRIHRFVLPDVELTGRNADNMEIYAGSPSYLITAGGSAATYAIDPGPVIFTEAGRRKSAQQLGVAMTTSFMP